MYLGTKQHFLCIFGIQLATLSDPTVAISPESCTLSTGASSDYYICSNVGIQLSNSSGLTMASSNDFSEDFATSSGSHVSNRKLLYTGNMIGD